MKDVRELLARLNPTTTRMDIGAGGGEGALVNIDLAAALGMVPKGVGRDLMELLYGPTPSRHEIIKVLEGLTRLVLDERNRRSKDYADARATWGIAYCMGRFNSDRQKGAKRHIEILKARVAVARALLMPENLEERLPGIATIAVGYMKGARLSNRERASVLGVRESTYRETWAAVVEWMLERIMEEERNAVVQFRKVLSGS